MTIADEIKAKIAEIERDEPDGRLKKLRITGLQVLLARFEENEK